ncbi:hypothetical protein L3Q82_013827, partial [Scortum barcoo]
AVMSLGEPTSDSAPFFSDDSEVDGPEDQGAAGQRSQEESASGVSRVRALLTVLILCYINLLNYMDRFTVAGVLPDIEHYFGIDDGKSGLLQTVFICSYMFLAPVFGYLGDRYNRKYIMSCGITFWSLVTLASSYTPKEHFWVLLLTRGLVGVGEASYSTIAPTIIADLYVKGKRTNMLSIFYFAIPVGSGLGYIVGSQVSSLAQDWHWALRVTPGLGLIAVLLLLSVVQEPKRGAIEARPEHHLNQTSWLTDLQALSRNFSFVLSTFGFTAVAFVTGSLALWAPTFLFRAAILTGEKAPCLEGNCASSDSLIFGVITCVTGVLGVASGVQVSRQLRTRTPRADPLVCAAGLLLSAPFLYLAIVFAQASTIATYVFIFLGETFLSMNWAIVADILLYVVVPTRRSTAEALQIVISHLLGDAGSPYLIGVVSDSLRKTDSFLWQFRSLQLSLLLCSFVAVVGGGFFLATALFIERDRHRAENYVPTSETGKAEEEKQKIRESVAGGEVKPGVSTQEVIGCSDDRESVTEGGRKEPTKARLRPVLSSPSAGPGTQRRRRSVTPTETESNPSYENPAGSDYPESDADEPGYIIVLPDGEAPPTNPSRASTPSSDVLHDYENVPDKKEDRDYLNVELLHFQRSTPDLSAQSDSDDDDDEDDDANYVNIQEGAQTD